LFIYNLIRRGYLFLFLCCFYSLGQAQVELNNNENTYQIGESISYLKDDSGTFSFEEVLSQNQKFTASKQKELNFGYTSDVIWVKITINNESDFNDWLLNLDNDNINYIGFYQKKQERWIKRQTGNYLPFATKEIKNTGFVFSLDVSKSTSKTYYLRIETETAFILPFHIQRPVHFHNHRILKTLYYGVFFGILLVMAIYNLFIYLTLKDKNYLFYVFTIIATLAAFSTISGYNFMLFWQKNPVLNTWSPRFSTVSLIISSAIFSTHFLRLKKHARTLHTLLLLNIGIAALGTLLHFFIPVKGINNLIAIYHIILLITAGAIVWRKGDLSGKYYLFAWTFYFLGGLIATLKNNGVFISNFFTHHAIELGAILEVVIISFALSEKYRILKQEKELTHKKYLQSQKEANEELEHKVHERTAELNATLDTMTSLYLKIEKKNTDINASINYASRIQNAFLAIDDEVKKSLPEHFIFSKARDVVSGDFHFFAQKDDKVIMAAVDCTGHGVPGAMMSMIGEAYLTQIVYSLGILDVSKILSELHYKVRMALLQDSDEHTVKDGMDMAICMIDKNTKTLDFAGARNPLIYIQDNQLHHIKGSKLGIGGRILDYQRTRSYEKHTISIKSETSVYLFTDGFQDQFGGKDDTKFMIKNLKELVFTNHTKSLKEQKQNLEKTFSEWKGDSRQIDDVLIIGFQLD
jgi:serine phosphatase RsbU (regulator of sigma subunit)